MNTTNTNEQAIVIGFGNELRSDDGIGPCVAKEVEARAWPQVKAVAVPQLTPELVAELATVEQAFFVDANAAPDSADIEVQQLTPNRPTAPMTHHGDPAALLGLAQRLYGRAPEAWMISASGANFELGEELSETARSNVQLAIEWIETLLQE